MNRYLVYCFYDKDGIADDYVFYFLDKIRPFCCGMCIVVNGELTHKSEDHFKKYTDTILKRENIGFDCGAFKHAVNALGTGYFKQFDEVIFANDSVYGPLFDLTKTFEKMETDNETDYWGITKHPALDKQVAEVDVIEHVQSYFLVFKKNLLTSEDFAEYWKNMQTPNDYHEAIAFYELYTAKFLGEKGYRAGSFIDIEDDISDRAYFYDVYKWVKNYRVPFIKKKIFEMDYQNMRYSIKQGAANLLKLIDKTTDYDIKMICENVERLFAYKIEQCNIWTLIFSYACTLLKRIFLPWHWKHYDDKLNRTKDAILIQNLLPHNKRILLVSHDLSMTGPPLILLWLAKYLIQSNYKVDVVAYKTMSNKLYSKFKEIGITPTIINNKNTDIYKYWLKHLNMYNLIICNTIGTYRFVDIAEKFKQSVAWYIHETKVLGDYINSNELCRKTFKSCKNIYALSEYAASSARKYNSNIKVISNGTEDIFANIKFNKERITFGFIGALTQQKGVSLLIDNFMELSKKYQNINLCIAGDYENTYAENLIAGSCENAYIDWLGVVTDSRKTEFYNTIDILCVPSIDDPSPLTILEGTKLSKAIIATETAGNCYLVKNKESGFIIPADNKNALYNAMEYFCLNPNQIESMQRESKNMYLEYGSTEYQELAIKALLKCFSV